jgi:hypothetical protein
MPSDRKLHVSLSMKIKGESTSVKVLPINLLVMPKARPLRSKFQKSSCRWHENSIVGMDPMATHCRKLIVGRINFRQGVAMGPICNI